MVGGFWDLASIWMHVAAAVCCTVLAVWFWRSRIRSEFGNPALVALALTGLWCVVSATLGPLTGWAKLAESARNLGWLWVVYRLFASDGRYQNIQPVRPVLITLVFLELFQPLLLVIAARQEVSGPLEASIFHVETMFRLLMVVGALVLVHNLYAGASATARNLLRWPATALAVMWIYDLNFYTIGYLSDGLSPELAALRGLAIVAMGVPLAIATSRSSDELKFRPSRAVTFQSLSLLVIGAYLVLMVSLTQSIILIGGDDARLTQVGFVFAASVAALLWLPSERLRRWLRVTVLKHMFQHRYDYREEWLRFTRTIGSAGEDAPPLHQRAIQVLADITDSPGGLLLVPDEHGAMSLSAAWQWNDVEVPATALSAETASFLERESYILDLDQVRSGADPRSGDVPVAPWLLAEPAAWIVVPLIHYDRLKGAVVLVRPAIVRQLDWEDFDMLRVASQQLASYLAEHAGQEALGEATRFEEFHRRIAFVMHDIKNLASQLSLLARNAERHAENPEFRADMLITLRNSADKLNALMARLGRYGSQGAEKLEPVVLSDCVAAIAARYDAIHPVTMVQATPCTVNAHRESLEQALVHLVQNAIDASPAQMPVFLRVGPDGLNGVIEVVDSGTGMSPEFVRTKLFKPFVSSRSDGFGIGAFEARELVRAMGGRLDVESREGLGTRFIVSLPLASTAGLAGPSHNFEQRVA